MTKYHSIYELQPANDLGITRPGDSPLRYPMCSHLEAKFFKIKEDDTHMQFQCVTCDKEKE